MRVKAGDRIRRWRWISDAPASANDRENLGVDPENLGVDPENLDVDL
jgi:hypothetical protein